MGSGTVRLELAEVARRLEACGVPWAVFAGAAAAAYGVPRPVNDIDILVPASAAERVAAAFPEAQIEYRPDGRVWLLKLEGCDILAGLHQTDLDEAMAARLQRREVLGVTVPVIAIEDNIALKAQRDKGAAEGKHDWEDVEAMLRAAPALDREYLWWRLEQGAEPQRAAAARARLEALLAGEEGLLYEERLRSPRMTALFALLTALFGALAAWRALAGGMDGWGVLCVILAAIFLVYVLNYRELRIGITRQALTLTFGIFRWRIPQANIAACALDDALKPLERYGGAGIHFMFVNGRYRASFNFLEGPRLALRLKQKAGMVAEVSFSTRHPQRIMEVLGAA